VPGTDEGEKMREEQRGEDKLRKIKITRNYLKYAEGSCLIELGNTRVICSASLEERVPPFLRDTGQGWVSAEYGMLPRSCRERIPRIDKTGGRAQEIQRLIGRSLRSVTDLKKLGERTLWIDCDVLQGDGGTRTAAITGGFIALYDALNKLKKDGLLEKIPLKDYIGAISVGISQGKPLLDLTYAEDSKADVDMNVVMTGEGKFVEIQGTAEAEPFSRAQMDALLALAKKGISEIIDLEKELLGKIG
jgi:ribonuclease PH